MSYIISDEMYNLLAEKAREDMVSDDPDFEQGIWPFAGGNIDDAYDIGYNDGNRQVARDIVANAQRIMVD